MTSGRERILLIRTDAGPRTGSGHVMRCLALAQCWQDGGGRSVFVMAGEPSPLLQDRLAGEGFAVERLAAEPGTVHDAGRTVELACRFQAGWVVLDGYHFSWEFQRQIKDAGLRLLAIDDYGHAEHYGADLVLNQNLTADERLYRRREPQTRLLLGTCYTLLRREFLALRGWQREIPPIARKVLVTLGGADPQNITLKAIRAVADLRIEQLDVVVVVGADNPHLPTLQAARAGCTHRIDVRVNVRNMPELMAWADVAVSAGGSSIWEMGFLGLPGVGISRAHQEGELLRGAAAHNMFLDLGFHEDVPETLVTDRLRQLSLDPKARGNMSRAGRGLIDGLGAERVVMALQGRFDALARA